MIDTEHHYPPLCVKHVETLIYYLDAVLPEELPVPTLLSPPPTTPVTMIDGASFSSSGKCQAQQYE